MPADPHKKNGVLLPGSSKKRSGDPEFDRQSAKLARYNLGGISYEDLMNIENDPAGQDKDARRQYVQRIHGIIDVLRLEVKRAVALQVDFNARWSENWDQTTFGRGGINSVEALLERWEDLSNEHIQNVKDDQSKNEPFDKFNPAPETES